jgi:hypothetical protein
MIASELFLDREDKKFKHRDTKTQRRINSLVFLCASVPLYLCVHSSFFPFKVKKAPPVAGRSLLGL